MILSPKIHITCYHDVNIQSSKYKGTHQKKKKKPPQKNFKTVIDNCFPKFKEIEKVQ